MGHNGDGEQRWQRFDVHSIACGAFHNRHLHWIIKFTVGRLFGWNCASNITRTNFGYNIGYHRFRHFTYLYIGLFYTGKRKFTSSSWTVIGGVLVDILLINNWCSFMKCRQIGVWWVQSAVPYVWSHWCYWYRFRNHHPG